MIFKRRECSHRCWRNSLVFESPWLVVKTRGICGCSSYITENPRSITRAAGESSPPPRKFFVPLEKCVWHRLKLLDIVQKFWVHLSNSSPLLVSQAGCGPGESCQKGGNRQLVFIFFCNIFKVQEHYFLVAQNSSFSNILMTFCKDFCSL